MQAALDPRSRSCLQPRLQPMHSGRPPLRPRTVPAKTSFPPRHTHTRIHDGGECQHNENTQTLPSGPQNHNPAVATSREGYRSVPGPALSLRGPSPGRTGGRVSFAPERVARKVIGAAWAAGGGRISAAANASEQEPIEMRGSDSFVFASLAQDKNCGCA